MLSGVELKNNTVFVTFWHGSVLSQKNTKLSLTLKHFRLKNAYSYGSQCIFFFLLPYTVPNSATKVIFLAKWLRFSKIPNKTCQSNTFPFILIHSYSEQNAAHVFLFYLYLEIFLPVVWCLETYWYSNKLFSLSSRSWLVWIQKTFLTFWSSNSESPLSLKPGKMWALVSPLFKSKCLQSITWI